MNTSRTTWIVGLAVAAGIAGVGTIHQLRASGADPDGKVAPITKAEYYRQLKESSNWGRWGKDDELGTLNLITPAKRKQAAALVKDGVTISLAELQIPNGLNKADPNNAPFNWGD